MNRYLINVATLLREPTGFRRNYTLEQIADNPEPDPNISGKVLLLRTDRGVLVMASVRIRKQLECSRCLAPFSYSLNLRIEEEYFPTINLASGLPEPPPEDKNAFTINENHIIDLGEAIRQYEVLAAPMKPLCRPKCAGLCPQCGRNLNQGPCSCSAPADERWATLRELISSGKIKAN